MLTILLVKCVKYGPISIVGGTTKVPINIVADGEKDQLFEKK